MNLCIYRGLYSSANVTTSTDIINVLKLSDPWWFFSFLITEITKQEITSNWITAFDAIHASTSRTRKTIHYYNSIVATTPTLCMHVYTPLMNQLECWCQKKTVEKKRRKRTMYGRHGWWNNVEVSFSPSLSPTRLKYKAREKQ